MNNPLARHALSALSHPLSVAALLVLLINDHWFKKVAASWLTGKLSDVAGLVFVPFVLLVLLAVVLPAHSRKHERGLGLLALFIVGSLFALIKTIPAVRDAAAQLFENVFGWPILIQIDPTDLLALPALIVAWQIWKKSAPTTLIPARSWSLLALSTIALVATSPAPIETGVYCLVLSEQGIVAPTTAGQYISTDSGLNWQVTTPLPSVVEKCGSPYGQYWEIASPLEYNVRYRFQNGQTIERSDDGGRTWTEDYTPLVTDAQAKYYETVRHEELNRGYRWISPSPAPLDAEFDPNTGNLIVAMGQEGILLHTPAGIWQYISVGPYARVELGRPDKTISLLRWELLAVMALIFLMTATLAGHSRRALTGVLLFLAWLPWAGQLIFVTPDPGGMLNLDIVRWSGLILTSAIAMPLAIVRVGALYGADRHVFKLVLAVTATAVLLFLVPYLLWSQGFISQYQTATFLALGVAFVLVVAGRLVIDVNLTRSASAPTSGD